MTDTFPTRSREQLVNRALSILGVVAQGQAVDQEDYDLVDDLVEPLFARLNAEKITYHIDAEGDVTQLDDPEAVPAKAYLDVAVLLAYDALSDFGISALPPPHDRYVSETRLRTVWSVGATQEEYTDFVTDLDTDEVTEVTRRRNETLVGEYM